MGIWRAVALAIVFAASPASAQLGADAQKSYDDYRILAPMRAFAVAPNGKASWWAGAAGKDPRSAVERALKNCADRQQVQCSLYAINNIVLNGRDWTAADPPALPAIGRLRPQPWWENKGPQAATGLVVWSHGYRAGVDSTNNAPQPYVGRFLADGYDLYRFDREVIRDWRADAAALTDAVRQARSMGYRRVILAGQSAGAWVSLAAAMRGAPVDGVISVAAAHHGLVAKMTDTTRARSDWQQLVRGLRPGPRLVVVNFAHDDYDIGGRMDEAKAAFAASGVDAEVIAEPPGFRGHGVGNSFSFARQFGSCIQAFVEHGDRRAPCG